MRRIHALMVVLALVPGCAAAAAELPNCARPLSLALHDHGLLYSSDTAAGIDKDVADELGRRSGCRINTVVMPRDRIWQLIESGALDLSLSGITNPARDKFASFAWYFSNKYYLLLRKDSGAISRAGFEGKTNLKLGVIRSFRYSASANDLVDRLNVQNRVSYASGLEPLYQLLLANQIQGMIIEPFDYPVVAAANIRAVTDIIEFGDPPVLHGLIMSRTSIPAAEQEKWRALVEEMRADGTILKIFEKYFLPDLAKAMTAF